MKSIFYMILLQCCFSRAAVSQANSFDPPWNKPPVAGINFTVHGIDNVPDLYGDIIDPQLIIFFGGNPFMILDDLTKAFKKKYPRYERLFIETLPPGILRKQIATGSLVIGNMRISVKPDIFIAGENQITATADWYSRSEKFASNKLTIMVRKGNEKGILGWKDLGRKDVRVSMPNPEWEGIGKTIESALTKAGGIELANQVMKSKVKDSSTFLTQIHHRQSPLRILNNQSDAAPVWYTEAYYQKMLGHPVDMVEIPDNQNVWSSNVGGVFKNAPHTKAANDFMDFITTEEAKSIFKKFGFKVD
jgi:molybdate transport system substrate-binding protein